MDQKRFAQIFRILIDNAIKYSHPNSTVQISSNCDYEGKLNPNKLSGVLFTIKDEGIGIPTEELPYLFGRFFRSETVQDIPGTGLGLSIAKNLVTLHHGDISVQSTFGKGTTFRLFFPNKPPTTQTSPENDL